MVRLPHADEADHAATRPGTGLGAQQLRVDEAGGIYVASRDHLHKVVWTGTRLSIDEADGAWTEPYSNTTGAGSGSTPALIGFGDEDRFVVITDGDVRMNVTLLWRDAIPDHGRACRDCGGASPADCPRAWASSI